LPQSRSNCAIALFMSLESALRLHRPSRIPIRSVGIRLVWVALLSLELARTLRRAPDFRSIGFTQC
jgi:hypothetical protein